MTVIPHDQLQPEILRAVIEEFITRDGAVHGHVDRSTSDNIESILEQIKAGKVAIVFDEETESCTIVPREELPED